MRYRLFHRRIIIEIIDILTIVIEPQSPAQTVIKQVLPKENTPTSKLETASDGEPADKVDDVPA